MPSERLVTATATVVFAGLSAFIWQDYISHTNDAYDARDTAKAQAIDLTKQLATTDPTTDDYETLSNDELDAEYRYQEAKRKINDIDGWNSAEWRIKNTVRFAAPAAAALCGAFTLLAIVNPIRKEG
jgi:hypothetical protein